MPQARPAPLAALLLAFAAAAAPAQAQLGQAYLFIVTQTSSGPAVAVNNPASAVTYRWEIRLEVRDNFMGRVVTPSSSRGCFVGRRPPTNGPQCPPPSDIPLLGTFNVPLTGTPIAVPVVFPEAREEPGDGRLLAALPGSGSTIDIAPQPLPVPKDQPGVGGPARAPELEAQVFGTFLGSSFGTEVVVIPQDVALKAQQLGLSQFFFVREFAITGFTVPPLAPPTFVGVQGISLTSSAAGLFSANRMEISFEGGRPSVVVPQYSPGLKAFVELRYSGTGTLRGRWRVAEPGSRSARLAEQLAGRVVLRAQDRYPLDDWRIIADVRQTITFGDRVRLESPAAPSLPTFLTGQHLVTLEILTDQPGDPLIPFQFPVARYFVEPGAARLRGAAPAAALLRLVAPADEARLPFEPPTFEWASVPGAAQYRVEIYEMRPRPLAAAPPVPSAVAGAADRAVARMESVGAPVLTALAQEGATGLSLHPAYLARFRPRQSYLWKVVALGGTGDVMAASLLRAFTFGGP